MKVILFATLFLAIFLNPLLALYLTFICRFKLSFKQRYLLRYWSLTKEYKYLAFRLMILEDVSLENDIDTQKEAYKKLTNMLDIEIAAYTYDMLKKFGKVESNIADVKRILGRRNFNIIHKGYSRY